MPNYRFNKTIAGYHLLMVLSAIDYKFVIEKEKIILEYLKQEFPFHVELDHQMDIISQLKPDEWKQHFEKCIDDFYDDATLQERNNFLQFAMLIVNADKKITVEENKFLTILYNTWEPDYA